MKRWGHMSFWSLKGPKRVTDAFHGCERDKELPGLVIYSY